MEKIVVDTNHSSYDIVFVKGGLAKLGSFIRPLVKGKNVLVVTDDNVAKHYLATVRASLEAQGFFVYDFVIKSGERSKNTGVYLDIVGRLAENAFLRSDIVLALGGGVVGDIAGFAAATYMRGVNLVQVPTSLLAMIDSSIGGKVGVDLPEGKNLLGAFYQPKLVFVDVNTLSSLPQNEWDNGLGEGLKYAVLEGDRIFEIMDEETTRENVEEFVMLCAKYKVDIVVKDEKESGLRRLLNLGHTLGHAIEKASGFEIPHGEAVKCGLKFISQASEKLGADENDVLKVHALLEKYNTHCEYPASELLPLVKNDKKAEDGAINAVMFERIGSCFVKKMSFEDFAKLFDL